MAIFFLSNIQSGIGFLLVIFCVSFLGYYNLHLLQNIITKKVQAEIKFLCSWHPPGVMVEDNYKNFNSTIVTVSLS